MTKYALAVMESSKSVRVENPSIKDVFGFFTNVRDPDTGELALTPKDVRRNTANFIVAGKFCSVSSPPQTVFPDSDVPRLRHDREFTRSNFLLSHS